MPPLEILKSKAALPVLEQLVLEERVALAALLNNTAFQKAWNNAMLCRPSLYPEGLNTALGGTVASNRLHELRGWELFKAALIRQAQDPKLDRRTPEETYPDPK